MDKNVNTEYKHNSNIIERPDNELDIKRFGHTMTLSIKKII